MKLKMMTALAIAIGLSSFLAFGEGSAPSAAQDTPAKAKQPATERQDIESKLACVLAQTKSLEQDVEELQKLVASLKEQVGVPYSPLPLDQRVHEMNQTLAELRTKNGSIQDRDRLEREVHELQAAVTLLKQQVRALSSPASAPVHP